MDKETNITICCPSRGRPDLAKRMEQSAYDTAKWPDKIKVKFYLNDDDPTLDQYKKHNLRDVEIGPDRSTVMSWNVLAESEHSKMYKMVGDDAEFITPAWDLIFLDQLLQHPDGIFAIGTATGKKHGMEHQTCPHPTIARQWRDALGYFWPPQFHHWCLDSYTKDLAVAVDRYIFLEDVMIKVKKITQDSTAKRIRTSSIQLRDEWLYNKTKECFFPDDVKRLRKAMQ